MGSDQWLPLELEKKETSTKYMCSYIPVELQWRIDKIVKLEKTACVLKCLDPREPVTIFCKVGCNK